MMKRYLAKRNNPWELLVIAALFLFPGVVLLVQHKPSLFPATMFRSVIPIVWSSAELHVFGWFGVVIAVICLALYFYARRSIAREEKASPPHFMEL
jgi:cell division protein FtsW (lipid II flippase)